MAPKKKKQTQPEEDVNKQTESDDMILYKDNKVLFSGPASFVAS